MYTGLIDQMLYSVSLLGFCDAGTSAESEQLAHIAGLLFVPMKSESIFHFKSWSEHKSRRPVESIGASEMLGAGNAFDLEKIPLKASHKLSSLPRDFIIAVDSENLYTMLTSQGQSVDKSIRGDVGVIRY